MSAISLNDTKALSLPKTTISKEKIQSFKTAIQKYINEIQNAIDNKENEEHLKNIINSFLLLNFYSDSKYTINTDGNVDSAIKQDGKLLAIIEAKTPYNKAEMLSETNINRKALWEAIYYYLERTVDISKSKPEPFADSEIRRLIVTDGIHWFLFDSEEIYNAVKNKLIGIFFKYKNNKLSFTKDNAAFYEIIHQELDEQNVTSELKYIYFDISECCKKSNMLTALYRVLSDSFLIKADNNIPRDTRSLNSRFYHELLYIMGLREVEKDNKQVIERDPTIENSLTDQVHHDMHERDLFADEIDEKAFELVLIWVNRLLFIKLFEGQLISFNSNSYEYRILTKEKIGSFDDLNKLFFDILGKKEREETEFDLRFKEIPYLNSSLFEVEDAERKICTIHSLKNNAMKKKSDSVLGKKAPDKIPVLDYIMDFLNSYNFSSVDDESEESKEIIDPAVLGWFFEKLNGYKDGAFFTPDVITDYLAKEAVEAAVVSAVNKEMNWKCKDLIEIKNEINGQDDKKRINGIINSLKICDPSVGSGHFLVSVLNRMIVVKKQLGVLFKHNSDELLKEYDIKLKDHVLTILDGDGKPFSYDRSNNESREVQETIFNEKRTIIENCLFGVDINPKAVLICRLRLWIELLKNAYYKNGVMDTLPNIDINIKSGNSLIYQVGFESGKRLNIGKTGLNEADVKSTLNSLKNFIKEYYSADDKNKKKEIRKSIKQLRTNLTSINSQQSLFKEDQEKKNIYFGAEEWLLDFPHLIDENLNFRGFDIVIGNPPYIQFQKMGEAYKYQKAVHKYSTFTKTGDIYCLFYELALRLLKDDGVLAYITSNKWMRAGYGELLREFLAKNTNPTHLIDFAGEKVFGAATVDVNIYICRKRKNQRATRACIIKGSEWRNNLSDYFEQSAVENSFSGSQSWVILSSVEQSIKRKIEAIGTPLKEWDVRINYGIKTGLNDAFIISGEKKDELIAADPKSAEIIRPILRGRDIRRYGIDFADLWIINTHNGIKEQGIPPININEYPAIKAFLDTFHPQLENRYDKGDTPYNLRNCIYTDDFSKQKIIWGEISDKPKFAFDKEGKYYISNTSFLMTGNDLDYIISFLNSTTSEYFFSKIATTTGVGTVRWLKYKIELLPIPNISSINPVLYSEIISAFKDNKFNEIDRIIYKILDFSDEEIAYICDYNTKLSTKDISSGDSE